MRPVFINFLFRFSMLLSSLGFIFYLSMFFINNINVVHFNQYWAFRFMSAGTFGTFISYFLPIKYSSRKKVFTETDN